MRAYHLLLILFISNCGVSNTEESTIKIVGYTYDVFESDTLKVQDVTVIVGENEIITNERGEFEIPDLLEGEYLFSFNSEYHESLDTVIEISSRNSINLAIELTPLYHDFTPIFVGSEWVYENIENNRFWEGTGDGRSSGSSVVNLTRIITVDSKIETENHYLYNLSYTNEGIKTEISEADTSTVQINGAGSYTLKELKSSSELSTENFQYEGDRSIGQVTPFFDGGRYVTMVTNNDGTCCGWKELLFRRYFPISRLPEGRLPNSSHYVVHEPDSGMTYYDESWSGNNGSGQTIQTLVSFTKGN